MPEPDPTEPSAALPAPTEADAPTPTPPPATVQTTPAFTDVTELAAVLGELTYPGPFPGGAITLTDGYAAYDDGSSGTPNVRLVRPLIISGDLDGDAREDAVALLINETSGTGRFTFLNVVSDVTGAAAPLDALMLGDRVGVKRLALDGDNIIAELVAQGPGDPLCCASWNVRKVVALQDGRLVETSSEDLSQISLDDLTGSSWRLTDLNAGQEPVLPETGISLTFDDGRLSGSTGCNDYGGTVSAAADQPNGMVVGEFEVTEQHCDDAIMAREGLYLERLGAAVSWSYSAGQLLLLYSLDGGAMGWLTYETVTDDE